MIDAGEGVWIDPEQYLRSPLILFAKRMEDKLRENDHKTGWLNDSMWSLFKRILDEGHELSNVIMIYEAMKESEPDASKIEMLERIIDEAADVANFAMMVADLARHAKAKNLRVDPLSENGVDDGEKT